MTGLVLARAGARASAGRAGLRRRRRRGAAVSVVLALLLVVVAGVALGLGPAGLAPGDVVAALVGRADTMTAFVILDLRLPSLATGAVVGACLAVSGGVFQTLARNPLASPDLIGITAGASVGGVAGAVALGLTGFALAGAAGAGAVVAALAVALASGREGLGGTRFVLIGVGVGAIGTAVTGYLLTRARTTDLQTSLTWLAGSLGRASWPSFAVVAVVAVVLIPLALAASRLLGMLALGDDLAAALGVPVARARLALVAVAVGLAAAAVATCGPIAFVALASGPVARRLLPDGEPHLGPTALVGALLVVGADQVAAFAVPGTSFPVGVVTGIVGAPYLLWLLARQNRRGAI